MGFNSSKDFGFGNGAASGGGGGGLTSVSTCNTNTFSFYGDGTIVNPLCGCPTLSSFANQGTIALGDGLWSPNPIRNGLVYGGIVTWLQNYDYSVSAAGYYINGVFYTSPQTTVTLAPSDPTLDRIDLFVVTTSGTATSITGTPANPPQSPTIDPNIELDISFALVTAGSTAPSVTSQYIYLNNAEWTTSVSSPTINPASPNNPFSAPLDVEFTNTPLNANITFTTAPFQILPTYQNLILYIRSKVTFPTNRRLLLTFRNGATTVGAGVIITGNSTTYGFDSTITSAYQRISIPLINFGLSNSSIINNLRIQVAGTGGFGFLNLYIDNIEIQSGTPPPDPQLNLYVPSLGFCSTIRCNVNNSATSQFSSALAGRCNVVNTGSCYSSVLSGLSNTINTSNNGVILGGKSNTLTNSSYSFIGGGRCNTTTSFNDTFILGSCITASQGCTTFVNCLSAQNLTAGCQVCVGANGVLVNFAGSGGSSGVIVLGAGTLSSFRCGVNNTSSGNYSAALGGQCNTSSSLLSTIVGGERNLAQGVLSFIGGGECNNVCGGLALGAVVVGGVGNNTCGGTWNLPTCTFTVAPTICDAGTYSFIGGGFQNRAFGGCSSVLGGFCNSASGSYSSISGGRINNATGSWTSVVGGNGNTTSGFYSTTSNGVQNTLSGARSFLGSGTFNVLSGCLSFIGGGTQNSASGYHTNIVGGRSNTSSGVYSIIGSGKVNLSQAHFGFIGSGISNNVCNSTSGCLAIGSVVVGGVGNNTTGGTWDLATCTFTVAPTICNAGQYSFIGGGFQNRAEAITSSVLGGQFNAISNNGCGSSISGGFTNSITGRCTFIGAGQCSVGGGDVAFIGSGLSNTTSNNFTFIGSGFSNVASGCVSFVGIGQANVASGNHAIIVGGCSNNVTQCLSFIGSGIVNNVNSFCSSVVGGRANTTCATASFIGGGFGNLICSQGTQSLIVGGISNVICNSGGNNLSLGSVVVGGVGNNTTGGTWDLATCTFTVAPTICNAGQYSFIGGGFQNRAGGDFSFNGGGGYNNICNITSCCSLGAVVVGGIGNNTTGGFFNVINCSFSGQTLCNAGANSFIGSGFQNRATENSAVVISGTTNTASGCCSFIGTGQNNTATVLHAFVGNGQSNNATGTRSFIGSGVNHTASGLVSVLVGGNQNTVSSYGGAILGGRCNVVASGFSSIVGGIQNVACAGVGSSFIGGGACNIVGGVCSVIVGGVCNSVVCNGSAAFIGGGINNSIQAYTSFIGSGVCNTVCNGTPEFGAYSAVVSGIGNNTTGGTWVGGVTSCFTVAPTPINLVGCYSFIGSGFQNRTIGDGSAIVGGNFNLAFGNFSVIGGGFCNNICASGGVSTACNRCLSLGAVVVGGVGNNTTGGTWDLATCTFSVAPTLCNTCQYSFVGGGFQNHARGEGDVVVGGECNGSIACSLGNNFIGGGFKNILAQNTACGFIGGGECNVVNCWSVVVGGWCNCGVGSVGASFVGGGYCNTTAQGSASIVGGFCNFNNGASGGFIGGGVRNKICCSNDLGTVIVGGWDNLICESAWSVISGGRQNTIFGSFNSIFSGHLNIVSNNIPPTGAISSIVGGCCNSITSICSFIGAGIRNTVSGNSSVIVGGNSNISSNCFTTIIGGNCNTSSSYFSTIVGGERNLAQGVLSFIGGGECNNVCNVTSGCLAIGSVVVGGIGNNTCGGTWDLATCTFTSAPTVTSSGRYSFIGGGFQNRVGINPLNNIVGGCFNFTSGTLAFIGGGRCNVVSGSAASVFNGISNTSSEYHSTVISGSSNTASGRFSLVSGIANTASGRYSSVITGFNNSVSSRHSTIVSGQFNRIISDSNGSTILSGYANEIESCCLVPSMVGSGSLNIIGNNVNTFSAYCVNGVCLYLCGNQTASFGAAQSVMYYNSIDKTARTQIIASSSFVGGYTELIGCAGTIWGTNGISNGYAINQSVISNGGGGSVISGGFINNTNSFYSFIGGGYLNNIRGGGSSLGSVVVGGVGNNTTGGTWDLANCCFTIMPTICNAGQYSFIGGGFQNVATGNRSSVVGGQLNNTCGFADAHIVGSCLNATQACTTFVNCLSAANLTCGNLVCVGANSVIVNTNFGFGAFSDTTVQTMANTACEQVITFNCAEITNGVSLVNTQCLQVSETGTYGIDFSLQLIHTSGGDAKASVWVKCNCTDIARSASYITINGNNSELLATARVLVNMNANDYLQLYWNATDTDVSLSCVPAGASPTRPVSPSIIANLQRIR